MFETIINFFKKIGKHEAKEVNSKDKAKERLHLVLMQDRANVSADFLEMMKQEIIEVIKKYIEVEENAIDVRLTNEINEDGTTGAPSLYANIPILNIRNEMKKDVAKNEVKKETELEDEKEKKQEEVKILEDNKDKQEDNKEETKKEELKEENLGKREEQKEQDAKPNEEEKNIEEEPKVEEDKKNESN